MRTAPEKKKAMAMMLGLTSVAVGKNVLVEVGLVNALNKEFGFEPACQVSWATFN